MRLAEDLLDQAWRLVFWDKKRPKQASLRRAISTAYYALFHLLIADAVSRLIPEAALRDRVSRSFQHGEMKQVCEQFGASPTPAALHRLLGESDASARLRSVAQAFLHLQEHRLLADYDVGHRLPRADAETIVDVADRAFRDWKGIASTKERDVFLTALAFGARWGRNR